MKNFFILVFLCFSLVAAEHPFIAKTKKCVSEKDADSCNEVRGIIIRSFENNKIPQKDTKIFFDSIIKVYNISCNESDSSIGCLVLALIYSGDINYLPSTKDKELYFLYLTKACILNNGKACHILGIKYDNEDIAIPFLKKACELGQMEACEDLKKIREK